MADVLHSLNRGSQISLNISIAGTNTFEVGNTVLPYNVSSDGSVGSGRFRRQRQCQRPPASLQGSARLAAQ